MPESREFSLGTVQVALSPLERFREFLESRGKRLTQQRRAMLEHVFSRHEHFEADELVEDLSYGNGQSKVSRPTVYRTLNEMVKAGLLRKLSVEGRAVYEHDYGYPQHDHLHCQQCGQLFEFRSEALTRLRDEVAQTHQFHVTGHRLIITGVCDSCRKEFRKRKRRPVDLV
jgi:Fur family ferric uptake transcriptional regulator